VSLSSAAEGLQAGADECELAG